jgi:hypothetical protein
MSASSLFLMLNLLFYKHQHSKSERIDQKTYLKHYYEIVVRMMLCWMGNLCSIETPPVLLMYEKRIAFTFYDMIPI